MRTIPGKSDHIVLGLLLLPGCLNKTLGKSLFEQDYNFVCFEKTIKFEKNALKFVQAVGIPCAD